MDIKDFIRILKENKNKENMTEDRRKEIIKKAIDTYGYDDKDVTKLSNTISFISLIHRIDLNLEHNICITKNIRQTNIRFEKGIINKLIIVSVQNAIDVKLRRENDRLCTKQI